MWKSAFSQQSYNLQDMNPSALSNGSPNVTILGNYCGLGGKITQYCTNTEQTLGIKDPNYPNPNACDRIDCSGLSGSEYTYSKLCKSMNCTINNSDFLNYEWTLASDNTGSVSSVFNPDGTLKFNIYALDDGTNANFVNAFCDVGRRIMNDSSCPTETLNYVSNSAAFKYFCCNDTPFCPDGLSSCSGKPNGSTVCTTDAANCMVSKGEFVSGSYNFQNFNSASLDNPGNLAKMMDYCSFGDDLISSNCKVDKYHPSSPAETAYPLSSNDPTVTSASIYKQYCAMNPACLKQIGTFNRGQWSYQYDAWNVLTGSEYDPLGRMATCTGNPASDNYLDTCELNSNGKSLVEFCDLGTNLYQNKCYDTFTVDPTDEHASNYPPIQYDMSYLTLCCNMGLGDDGLCNVNSDVVKKIPLILPDSSRKEDTNKTVYQYLKTKGLKLQK